jgi:transposase
MARPDLLTTLLVTGLAPVWWTPYRGGSQAPRKESTVGKTRPPYPRQFREEAVRFVRESGKTRARIAKDLGISEQSLYTWVKQADLDGGKRWDGLTTEEREEIRRLRREVRILREERDILKKAAVFFAKETNSTP